MKVQSGKLGARKITEWLWHECPGPSVEFLNDEVVALGSSGATLTVMEFSTRKVLFQFKRDAEAQARSDLEPFTRTTEYESHDRVLKRETQQRSRHQREGESMEEAVKRRMEEMTNVWSYRTMTTSADGTLLACCRHRDPDRLPALGAGEIDVWDVLRPECPTLIRTIPSPDSKDVYLDDTSLSKVRWTDHSNKLLLVQTCYGPARNQIVVIDPRTGLLLKSIDLPMGQLLGKDGPALVVELIDYILPHPSREEVAVRRARFPISRDWCILDLLRKRKARIPGWPAHSVLDGPAIVLPSTNLVVCFSGVRLMFETKSETLLEIWEWKGRKVAALPFDGLNPKMLAMAPNDKFFACVAADYRGLNVENKKRMRSKRIGIVVQAISIGSWQKIGEVCIPTQGTSLAVRVCQDGQIRLVTGTRTDVYGRGQYHVSFWAIDVGC